MAKTTTRKEAPPAAAPEPTLQPLIEEIQQVRDLANLNPETIPYAVRGGWELRKGEAQQILPRLMEKLRRELFPSRVTAVIASENSDVDTCDNIVTRLGPTGVAVDAFCLYQNIAAEIRPSMGDNPTFGVSQYTAAIAYLRQEAERLGVTFRTPPDYREVRCPDAESLTDAIRSIARATMGDDLLVAFAKQEIVDQVLFQDPVARYRAFVYGTLEEERPALTAIFGQSAVHDFLPGIEWSKDDISDLFTTSSTS